jgi:dihydroorotate dehydrogenase electron transfer subunit
MQLNCAVVKAERLNADAISLTLNGGELARQAQVGQFVHISCGHSRLLRRPISICDVEGDLLRVVFEVRGEGTEWLSHRTEGDVLDVLGPLGHGFHLEKGGKYLVVGGGIGVPPMLYTAKQAGPSTVACLGFRSKEKAMLLSEFEAVCDHVAVTSDDGTLGAHGFVDALVREELAKDKAFTAILACGPKLMLRSVAKAAEEAGVACQVSMEERMGCGVGACLVCACKTADGHYKHVCKDGPVFDAKEVDWNA